MNKSMVNIPKTIKKYWLVIVVLVVGLSSGAAWGSDNSYKSFEQNQYKVGREKYSKWIAKQVDEILKQARPAFAELMSGDCLREVVTELLRKYKPKEVKQNIEKWNTMIKGKNFDLVKFWDQVLHCEGFCSLAIAHLITCYMNSVATNYLGFILFDYGEFTVKDMIRGGWWSNYEVYNNKKILERVVRYLRINPDMKVYLHARASLFGKKATERGRSIHRAKTIKSILTKGGISEDKIKIQAFGWEPPHIDEVIAQSHGFKEEFIKYSKTVLNQSVLIYIYD